MEGDPRRCRRPPSARVSRSQRRVAVRQIEPWSLGVLLAKTYERLIYRTRVKSTKQTRPEVGGQRSSPLAFSSTKFAGELPALLNHKVQAGCQSPLVICSRTYGHGSGLS